MISRRPTFPPAGPSVWGSQEPRTLVTHSTAELYVLRCLSDLRGGVDVDVNIASSRSVGIPED